MVRDTLNYGFFFFASIIIDGNDNSRIRVENITMIVQRIGYSVRVLAPPVMSTKLISARSCATRSIALMIIQIGSNYLIINYLL